MQLFRAAETFGTAAQILENTGGGIGERGYPALLDRKSVV